MSRICEAPDCQKPFDPTDPSTAVTQKFCSERCATRVRVARCRARKRGMLPPPPGGGGPDGGGLYATVGGAAEYHPDGFVSDKNGYSVKPAGRKPSRSASQPSNPHTAFQRPLFDLDARVA